MSLKKQLLEDMKVAMREKDSIKKDTIQMARSAVLQVEKDNKVNLNDDGIVEIIAKEIKKRRDTLPAFEKSGRQDLIDKLKYEIDILMKYLPEQLTEEELEVVIKEVIKETAAESAADIGKVMQKVMPRIRGRADGKAVNQIVKRLLA
jgi:uncharacterized protein YqeY